MSLQKSDNILILILVSDMLFLLFAYTVLLSYKQHFYYEKIKSFMSSLGTDLSLFGDLAQLFRASISSPALRQVTRRTQILRHSCTFPSPCPNMFDQTKLN